MEGRTTTSEREVGSRVTAHEYAQLAKHVYSLSDAPPEGWEVIRPYERPDIGLQAAAYRKGGNVVLSIRGTHVWRNWIYDNVWLPLGIEPTSVRHLAEFLSSISSDSRHTGAIFSATGHSLGGALAAIVGWKSGKVSEVMTFDSPATSAYTELPSANRGLRLKIGRAHV